MTLSVVGEPPGYACAGAMIPVISNQNFIYLGNGKPMTLKCTTSNVSFTGSIKLETYSYGATVIARGNEIDGQDMYVVSVR